MVNADDGDWPLESIWPPDPLVKGNLTAQDLHDWQMITAYDSQQPFYSSSGIDCDDAQRLLGQRREPILWERWNYSPTIVTILRSIVEYPQVRGNAAAPSGVPDGHFGISGVLIDDPELLTFEPDIKVGPVPPWSRTWSLRCGGSTTTTAHRA